MEFVGENGVDAGGLSRDMLSAFWENAYCNLFDGGSLLSPAMHPTSELTSFSAIGKILSHGYMVTGFLPVRIAYPSLASILIGSSVIIPDPLLLRTFESSISCHEASIVRDALSVKGDRFSSTLLSRLISLLGRYGCREVPTPEKLRQIIVKITHYEYQIKPLAGIAAIRSGIPMEHLTFWNRFTAEKLYSIVVAMCADPSKVIDALFSETKNEVEERVFTYLQQFIASMNQDMLRRFLRFVTGSSVFTANEITVIYNSSSGLARCPIAHTCTCTLELPVSYETYGIFVHEFEAILSDTLYVWRIDFT